MPGRVIKQEQDAFPGQVVTPQPAPRLEPGRDVPGGGSRCQQKTGQGLCRVHRMLARSMAVQGQKDLPVRELPRELVRCMHRECCLPDVGHPADRTDADHSAGTCSLSGQACQVPELTFAASETGNVTRERPGGLCHYSCRECACGGAIRQPDPCDGLSLLDIDFSLAIGERMSIWIVLYYLIEKPLGHNKGQHAR